MASWCLRIAAVVTVVIGAGCAPVQQVPLDLEPASASVFVDGEPLPSPVAPQLELRADKPHVLFFKHEGYRSQQRVLESRRVEGRHQLEPGRVEVRLVPVASSGRSLRMELDEGSEAR